MSENSATGGRNFTNSLRIVGNIFHHWTSGGSATTGTSPDSLLTFDFIAVNNRPRRNTIIENQVQHRLCRGRSHLHRGCRRHQARVLGTQGRLNQYLPICNCIESNDAEEGETETHVAAGRQTFSVRLDRMPESVRLAL